ncbi:MAG: 50S ribosomal protein L10 [Deltaproteobacteria bacterium]|nr:50S ribosomal protein L10 [Deltaproteobacteria bacterium]
MERIQKPKEVEALRQRFTAAKTLIFAENKGLKVSEVTELRKRLKNAQSSIKVVKNRLVKRALKEAGLQGLDGFFEGPVAVASSEVDPVSPAKVLVQFIKDHEQLAIKGGWMSGEVLTTEKIRALASLPSKEELYAKLMGCLLNPARNLVGVLAALPRQVVTVIDAIGKKKEVPGT